MTVTKKTIISLGNGFEKAINEGSTKDAVKYLSEDSQWMAGGRSEIKGQEAIVEHLEMYRHDGIVNISRVPKEFEELGSTVVEIGDITHRNQEGSQLLKGQYMTLWKREAGKWLQYRNIISA